MEIRSSWKLVRHRSVRTMADGYERIYRELAASGDS